MYRKGLTVLLFAMLLATSCSDETTIFNDDLQQDLWVENSEDALSSSISFASSGVLDIYEDSGLGSKAASAGREEQAGDYPLNLVAQVRPPDDPSRGPLTSSHVFVENDYALVSYNTVGEEYFGAVDIINIKDPAKPRLVSRLLFPNADINALISENGYVYAAGGLDAEVSVTATSNSFVAKIPAPNGKIDVSAGITYGFQQGFNANDLRISGDKLLVTSGKEGSLTIYNKSDLSIVNEFPYFDLRSIALSEDRVALLDAGSGLKILDASFQLIKEIPISTDLGLASKKTIDFQGDRIIVAEAGKGAGVYSESTGNLIEYLPIAINPDGITADERVTNAVVSNENVVLMANGGAGLCLNEEKDGALRPYGVVQLEGSINYVQSKGDYIIAASGREGLQIIKLNRPSESLESRCSDLPMYSGSSKLFVPEGQQLEYKGAKRFNNINVSGSLLLCGTWTVLNNVSINEGGLFEYRGHLFTGQNSARKEVRVGQNATLRVEGSLTIYGDLILEDGASLEFLGDASRANIFGQVIRGANVQISGSFEDVRNKF
ncbi:hypothetical protein [Lentiprolixibacter aurantiacus]|uniref:Lipoprotein n=1 Tax=Lentiprolixibacter aurantiacus TaxID=2993939 RepID=A0AAE3SPQ4_9FLAO|nr:hypothetical protein [Lentiprolixibacter aurantiacus]MCX2719672.1 hypothetical protein [Lentiprolixibacter aurantiacus]